MIVLVRNCETIAEEKKIFLGQQSTKLTAYGQEQAKEIAETLNVYTFSYVFASEETSALETMDIIMSMNNIDLDKLTVVPELKNASAGVFEGMTYPEVRELVAPRNYKLWERDFKNAPKDGESMSDIADRLQWFIDQLRQLAKDNQQVLIVSAEVPMKVIIGRLRGMKDKEIPTLPIVAGIPYVLDRSVLGG